MHYVTELDGKGFISKEIIYAIILKNKSSDDMFLGIITEDEHQILQLGIYISLKKYVILPPIKGAMGRGRAGLETGTSTVQGVTTAVTTC